MQTGPYPHFSADGMPGHCTTGRNPDCSWFADRWHFPTDSQICSCKTPAQKAYHWPQQSQKNSPCVKSFFSVQDLRTNCSFSSVQTSLLQQLVNPFQSAYKAWHSTETALLEIVNDLLFSIDDRNIFIVTFLDISAAFDKLITTFYVVVLSMFLVYTVLHCSGSPHTCPTEFKLSPSTT